MTWVNFTRGFWKLGVEETLGTSILPPKILTPPTNSLFCFVLVVVVAVRLLRCCESPFFHRRLIEDTNPQTIRQEYHYLWLGTDIRIKY